MKPFTTLTLAATVAGLSIASARNLGAQEAPLAPEPAPAPVVDVGLTPAPPAPPAAPVEPATAVDLEELLRAVRSNDTLRIEALLTKTPDSVNARTVGNATPLHIAAAMDHDAVAALLLSKGARIDARTSGGFTPLHWTAERDAARTAKLLVAMGADTNARNEEGVTPLHWAASRNASEVVRVLVESGADVSAKTSGKMTPLHWAVMKEAGDASLILAFKTVSEQMAKDAAAEPPPPTPPPPPETTNAAIVEPEPPPAKAEPSFPPPTPGKSLIVPMGQGEYMVFMWVDSIKTWVGKYEITNGQYRRFKPQHKSLFYGRHSLDGTDQPVVRVSWQDATAFCEWLNKNYADRVPKGHAFRLPAAAEWMTVARCGDTRIYPWGRKWPPTFGNFADNTALREYPELTGIRAYDDGFVVSCPVTVSGENELGIFGMAGNVWEWCSDAYDAAAKYRVRIGGSWDFTTKDAVRIDATGFDRSDARYDAVGFRVIAAPVR